MAGKRLDIMDLKQLISFKNKGYSNRKVATALGVSRNTVNNYVRLFEAHHFSYKELLRLDKTSLQELFPSQSEIDSYRYKQLVSYFPYFSKELKKPGCTLQILWQEYLAKHPDGYKHSQFNYYFSRWCNKVKVSGKLAHKAGEKVFIDYTGKKLPVIDKSTGEVEEVNVFVGILPCSQYTFVKACRTQNKEDFISVMTDCLEYFEGVPLAIISDNLKSAVSRTHKYAPSINKTFKDLGLYYDCEIAPTRPYKPKDKALVEGAVKLVYQRIFYPLNKHDFFSLSELNKAIADLLEQYNDYKFAQRDTTRRQAFLSIEKKHLQLLPAHRYEIKYFKRAKVHKMGYILLNEDKHYYSVPYRFTGKQVEIHYTADTVEVFYNKTRIALHQRNYRPGKYTTITDHLSSAHKAYSEWNLDFFQKKAARIGPSTETYVTELILEKNYPEMGYRQAHGITVLKRQYPTTRIENACKLALQQPRRTYHIIENILKNKLDELGEPSSEQLSIPLHENIRGKNNYH